MKCDYSHQSTMTTLWASKNALSRMTSYALSWTIAMMAICTKRSKRKRTLSSFSVRTTYGVCSFSVSWLSIHYMNSILTIVILSQQTYSWRRMATVGLVTWMWARLQSKVSYTLKQALPTTQAQKSGRTSPTTPRATCGPSAASFTRCSRCCRPLEPKTCPASSKK